MSWEHLLAKEIKNRDNPMLPNFFTGTVVSTSPLTVSAFDGAVMLKGAQLKRVDPYLKCSACQSCTPQSGATSHFDGGTVLHSCSGCSQGNCIQLRALQVGQTVALAGEQVYFILGVVVDT